MRTFIFHTGSHHYSYIHFLSEEAKIIKRGRIAEATWRRSHNIATIQSRNGDAVKKKKWLDRHDNLCDFLQKVFGVATEENGWIRLFYITLMNRLRNSVTVGFKGNGAVHEITPGHGDDKLREGIFPHSLDTNSFSRQYFFYYSFKWENNNGSPEDYSEIISKM